MIEWSDKDISEQATCFIDEIENSLCDKVEIDVFEKIMVLITKELNERYG